jgi:hypothetical protein
MQLTNAMSLVRVVAASVDSVVEGVVWVVVEGVVWAVVARVVVEDAAAADAAEEEGLEELPHAIRPRHARRTRERAIGSLRVRVARGPVMSRRATGGVSDMISSRGPLD